MTERKLGQDFADLKAEVRKLPGMGDYLDSYSVVIGNLVFARRMQMGYTQTKLAELSGTNQAHISRIEAGDESITAKVLNNVFRVLKLASLKPLYDEEAASKEFTSR
ncbi:helix-turn-helix domain-containing protein [Cohnella silvisoli]|uniref:Helix-turn-helix transcriptional regulator n=1 Tax=Cohnella silvisoli TaxID=2873699 RepID=A0ABV1KN09_9BACL|nr:helix-turn-helix transcriptional regulator [Cohnella silvisoli]MCD9020204.1 helix-turn-helix domain-containing protein [Cohnella silvisoli]